MRRFVLSFLVGYLVLAEMATGAMPDINSPTRIVEVADGSRLAVTISLPEGVTEAIHPLFFTQWVSCGPLDYRQGQSSSEIFRALARKSGLALVQVERSALGNSGPSCGDLDYDTEVAHYVDAFTQLLDDERLDGSRIYLYGSSLGSTVAPLVAQQMQRAGHVIAGIMIQGGGAVTYYERMLNFERNYLERRPNDVAAADIQDEILSRAQFHYEYLINGRHPDEIAKDSANMALARRDILGMTVSDHYGRPFAWHQQAAKHNFLAAWAEVKAPVLVIFNAFDQFEVRHGHKLITDTVNRLRPGTASYVERANIGHSDNRYATIEDAYAWQNGTPAWQEAAEIMLAWLQQLNNGCGGNTEC